MEFTPFPLWIACCNLNDCIHFLVENMNQEGIAQAGPDGTTALMQLFANVEKKKDSSSEIEQLILDFTMNKFGPRQVLETSILFANQYIFRKLFNMGGVSLDNAMEFAKLAIKAEDTNILGIIFEKNPILKEECKRLVKTCQTRPMLELFDISFNPSDQSQLMKMSQKFPKFNESLEKAIKPLPKHRTQVSIEEDIKPLLKDEFCGIVACYGKAPKSVPIAKWEKTPCKRNHER